MPIIADAGDAITVHADSTTTFMGTVSGPNLLGTKAPVPITAAVTLDGTAAGKWYVISGTSADYTITLPAPATVGAGAIIGFTVRPWAEATRQYSIASASLVDGRPSQVLIFTNALTLVSDGSTWTALTKKVDTDWVDGGTIAISTPNGIGMSPKKGTTSVDKVRFRRCGDSAEISYSFSQVGSTDPGNYPYLLVLPNNLRFDTSKIEVLGSTPIDQTSATARVVGHGGMGVEGNPSQRSLIGLTPFSGSNAGFVVVTGVYYNSWGLWSNSLFALNYPLTFHAEATIPILGW